MHAQREMYLRVEGQPDRPAGARDEDGRDDPTLVWTGSRALQGAFTHAVDAEAEAMWIDLEDIETESPRRAALGWQSVTAATALFGAVLLMRVLIIDGPAPGPKPGLPSAGVRARAALAAEAPPEPVRPAAVGSPAAPGGDSEAALPHQPEATLLPSEPEAALQPASEEAAARVHSRRHHAAPIRRETADEGAPARSSRRSTHSRISATNDSARPSSTGTLRINSLPWAEIYLDGKPVGTTPQANLPVKAGRHRVRLVSPTLDMSKTLVVEVRPDQVVTRSINLAL